MLLDVLFITGEFERVEDLCKKNILLARAEKYLVKEVELEFHYARSVLELGGIEQSVLSNQQARDKLLNIPACDADVSEAHSLCQLELGIIKNLAFAFSLKGDIDEAIKLAQEAKEKADASNITNEMITRRAYLALYLSYKENLDAAQKMYDEALLVAHGVDPQEEMKYELALTYGLFSEFNLAKRNFQECIRYSENALDLDRSIQNPISGSWCNWLLALSYAHQGALELSLKHTKIACLFNRPLNNPNPNVLLGILYLRQGEKEKGVMKLQQSITYIENKLLNKCINNWEAIFAKALALLALTSVDAAYLSLARSAYTLGKRISPNKGHLFRLRIQAEVVQPLLSEDVWSGISELLRTQTTSKEG
jgi:tetratricopeptide (TPR) repeat protein